MPELIDRQALIKDMCNNNTEAKCPCFPNCYPCDFSEARRCIDIQPTIEPEVRHGRWIECDYKHMEHGMSETEPNAGLCCSECRTAFQKKKMTYKQYCAACGARMDAEDINVLAKDGGADNG